VRPLYRKILIGIAAVVLLIVGVLMYVASRLDGIAHDYALNALQQKYKNDVELGPVKISLLNGVSASAQNLKFHQRGRTGVPPLIEIAEARAKMTWLSLLRQSKTISSLELKGLRINIPPKVEGQPRFDTGPPSGRPAPDFLIRRVSADGTILRIIPKEPGKDPLEWNIRKLKLQSAGPKQAMRFDAVLTNAKPPGDINSKGHFGPWNADDPGQTPLDGDYTFKNADLSVFKGIAGILSSQGQYTGVLEKIDAKGTTLTPDFRLGADGNPLPLKADFHAIIDGTSGDTYLQPVRAMLANTPIECSGGVYGKAGVKGKTIDLDMKVSGGRIDDMLRLAIKTKHPPLVGGITLKAKLVIPPGDVDVVRKLRLKGDFAMNRVSFTDNTIQDKLESLSTRARGKPDAPARDVTSHFDGKFDIANGTITMDRLIFAMPGADVKLAGSYGMRSEKIDFAGHLLMDARISETVGGYKSWLLKPIDPFFAKDGRGAVIPIKITGTREDPQYGLNFGGGNGKKEQKNKK
jgi:hypothetical protein